MYYCTTCKSAYRERADRCPADGTELRDGIPDPVIGHVVGERYRILSLIASGGMGQVYRAEHISIRKPFAVKLLYGDLAVDERNVKRFQREAESASRLDHLNIINITDFGRTAEGLLYIAMELLQGEELGRVIHRDGPLDPQRAVVIARQMARALSHAHDRHLVHRDLKVENVMLIRRDEISDFVKILDFGLARLREHALDLRWHGQHVPEARKSGYRALSEYGTVFGTPEYMSPEQAQGKEVDHRSDLYSLGVIIYQMLTGKLPFDGQSAVDICAAQILDPPRPFQAIVPGVQVDRELEAAVMRLLAKRPEDRHPSAAALLEDLDRFPPLQRYLTSLATGEPRHISRPVLAPGEPGPELAVGAQMTPPPVTVRRPPWASYAAIGSLGLAAAAVAALYFFVLQRPAPEIDAGLRPPVAADRAAGASGGPAERAVAISSLAAEAGAAILAPAAPAADAGAPGAVAPGVDAGGRVMPGRGKPAPPRIRGSAEAYRKARDSAMRALRVHGLGSADIMLIDGVSAAYGEMERHARARRYDLAVVEAERMKVCADRFDFHRSFLGAKLTAVGRALREAERVRGTAALRSQRARWEKAAADLPAHLSDLRRRRAFARRLDALRREITGKELE